MADFHVLIVGAGRLPPPPLAPKSMLSANTPQSYKRYGITGLLLAQALKKANITYTLFEAEVSAEAYRPRQWGLSIHWSTPLLKRILPEDLWERVHEAQCDPFYQNPEVENLNIYDGTTGQKMNHMYNKKLTSIAPSEDGKTVTATFEDGSSYTGSILVGADGTNSKVRHLLLGEEKAIAQPASTPEKPFVFTNSTVQYKAEQALFLRQLHPTFYMCLHPEGGLFWVSPQDVPDQNDPSTWKFQLFMNWRGTTDRRNVLPELKVWASKLVDPWKSAIEWLSDDEVIETQKIAYWYPIERDNWGGRVTLAGDAAHPMVPFRGQGLSHCIADVTSLLAQLQAHLQDNSGMPLAAVINEYDAEVVARAGDEVKTSLQTMEFLMTWELVEQSPSFKRSADPNEAAMKIIGKA
ncbi:hypothetical protein LTR85_010325 [Meristemomyces frigidus]|nr:hypothetical protein LTR85_010325 [Meristemomyces frigidus]